MGLVEDSTSDGERIFDTVLSHQVMSVTHLSQHTSPRRRLREKSGRSPRTNGSRSGHLGSHWRPILGEINDVVALAMSEVDRARRKNVNRKTGYGKAIPILGGGVHGRRVCGPWPSLDREHRSEGAIAP